MNERNKSATELVDDERTQDARAWRRHWEARAAEAGMQDEGDLLVRPQMTMRVLGWAALAAVVIYGLLVGALILIAK